MDVKFQLVYGLASTAWGSQFGVWKLLARLRCRRTGIDSEQK